MTLLSPHTRWNCWNLIGQFFCHEVILGGMLLSTKALVGNESQEEEKSRCSFKHAIGMSVSSVCILSETALHLYQVQWKLTTSYSLWKSLLGRIQRKKSHQVPIRALFAAIKTATTAWCSKLLVGTPSWLPSTSPWLQNSVCDLTFSQSTTMVRNSWRLQQLESYRGKNTIRDWCDGDSTLA